MTRPVFLAAAALIALLAAIAPVIEEHVIPVQLLKESPPKPLDEQPAQLGLISLTLESLAPPPERPAGRIVGEGAAAVPELVRLLREEAKVL